MCRPRISNILDRTIGKFDVIASGHVLSAAGTEIQIDLSRDDEGIWLEKETRKGSVTIARAKVLNTSYINTEFIFDEPIPRGKYFVTIRSRCGRGTEYRVLRGRHEVTAL